MGTTMMKCGHTAQGTSSGKPVCVICIGITAGAREVTEQPDLTGRRAQCPYCHTIRPSRLDLAFFELRANKEFDSFYCGCRGWE